jgi:hypothetical protein
VLIVEGDYLASADPSPMWAAGPTRVIDTWQEFRKMALF